LLETERERSNNEMKISGETRRQRNKRKKKEEARTSRGGEEDEYVNVSMSMWIV